MELEQLNNLLKSFQLSADAIKVIIEKGYTSLNLLKSLVPSAENFKLLSFSNMPDQTMYTMKWQEWMKESKQAEKLSNSLTTPFSATGINQFDQLGQNSSSESEVELSTRPPTPTQRPAQSHPESSAQSHSETSAQKSEFAPGICNPLKKILEKSPATRQLLQIGLQREFRRSEQSQLCDIILDHLLKDSSDQKPKLAYGVFIQWAKYVHDLFPKEPEAIWFSVTPPLKQEWAQLSPGAKAPPSASARPHGKLYDRYGKRQAIWWGSRGLVKKTTGSKRTSSNATAEASVTEDSDEIGTAPRRRKKESQVPLRNEDHIILEEELKTNEDITTISNYQGLESTSLLETAWTATWSLRKRYLLSVPAAQYLKKFPVLCLKDVGQRLINIDFTTLHSNISLTALYTGLRKNSYLIENRAYAKLRSLSKPLRAQQQRFHDLPKDTELQKLTAVLLLLPFAIVGGKTGVRTKASRFDAAMRFIFIAKTRSEGEAHLKELREAASKKSTSSGIGVQPLVIGIGEDLSNIESAFVVVDDIWFCCRNILEAVDLCFKTFYVFNLKYPIECEYIWQVLQFTCYGIRDAEHDKCIIDVNSFLNEITNCSQDTGNASSQVAACSSSQEPREISSEETGVSSPLETRDLHSDSLVT